MALYTKGNKYIMAREPRCDLCSSMENIEFTGDSTTAPQFSHAKLQLLATKIYACLHIISSIHVFASLADQELPFSPINRPQSLLPLASPYSCRANNVVFKDFQWQVK